MTKAQGRFRTVELKKILPKKKVDIIVRERLKTSNPKSNF